MHAFKSLKVAFGLLNGRTNLVSSNWTRMDFIPKRFPIMFDEFVTFMNKVPEIMVKRAWINVFLLNWIKCQGD